MRRLIRISRSAALGVAALILVTLPLAAQESAGAGGATALARQSLRPYVHVFIAYSIAILLVLGWVISLSRRMSRLEKQLQD